MVLSYSKLRKPVNKQLVDPSTGRLREDWDFFFAQLTTRLNAAVDEAAGLSGGIGFVIDGGASDIVAGLAGSLRVPIAMTITAAYLLADQNGDIQIDIWKDSYGNYPPTNADSITASAPLTLSGAMASADTTLSGWTTSISAGDILYFNVDSVSSIKRCEISLSSTKV